jgi:phage terminase large subunit-like protein
MTDVGTEAVKAVKSRKRALEPRPPAAADRPTLRIGDMLAMDADARAKVLAELTPAECAQTFYDWSFWARPDQEPPPGDWIVWLILAGRGAGKTRAGAEAVRRWTKTFPLVNLIGPTADDVRDVMVLGESGILNCCRKDERPRYLASAGRLEWPGGAKSFLFSADEPDRLRGKQHMKLWCDELAAWRRPEAFDQAMLGLRLGDKPQMVVTTTPRPTKIVKQLAAGEDTIVTRGSTFMNKGNLATAFLRRIARRYEGRAIGRQELYAEIVEGTPGALWTRALIERQRVAPETAPQDFAEVVVAVDPPARSSSKSDECGIVVAGKASDGRIFVLADLTSQGDTPGAWAARVGTAYRSFRANRVVAEINNGGDMVAEVLRQAEPHLPVRSVTATRGKFLRAEPIAAAYERGLIFHSGVFAKLEDQLCALTPDFDRKAAGYSPDRADALVWAIADLLALERGKTTGMIDFWAGR